MKFLKPNRKILNTMELGETRVFDCSSSYATGCAKMEASTKMFEVKTVLVVDPRDEEVFRLQAITYTHK